MPTPRHTNRTLRTATHILTNAAERFPTWRRWITANLPDGYPTSNTTEPTGPTNTVSDPTGNTAIERHDHTHLLDEADRTIRRLHELATHLEQLLTAGPPEHDHLALVRAARCSGSVDPTCTRLADGHRHRSGLCDRCWQIRYRQERAAS